MVKLVICALAVTAACLAAPQPHHEHGYGHHDCRHREGRHFWAALLEHAAGHGVGHHGPGGDYPFGHGPGHHHRVRRHYPHHDGLGGYGGGGGGGGGGYGGLGHGGHGEHGGLTALPLGNSQTFSKASASASSMSGSGGGYVG